MASLAGSHQKEGSNLHPENSNMALFEFRWAVTPTPDITVLTNKQPAQLRARQYNSMSR
jgi:hypothetical protein